MALPITQISDFEAGRFALPRNPDLMKQLDAFIDENEECVLDDLLGCELAALFIADLDVDNIPQTQRFIDIMNKFCVDVNECGHIIKSNGIKQMLKGFVYFYFGRSLSDILSTVGAIRASGENSKQALQASTLLRNNFNYSIDTFQSIQEYICLNPEEYPEYNGVERNYIGLV